MTSRHCGSAYHKRKLRMARVSLIGHMAIKLALGGLLDKPIDIVSTIYPSDDGITNNAARNNIVVDEVDMREVDMRHDKFHHINNGHPRSPRKQR